MQVIARIWQLHDHIPTLMSCRSKLVTLIAAEMFPFAIEWTVLNIASRSSAVEPNIHTMITSRHQNTNFGCKFKYAACSLVPRRSVIATAAANFYWLINTRLSYVYMSVNKLLPNYRAPGNEANADCSYLPAHAAGTLYLPAQLTIIHRSTNTTAL